MLSVDPPEVLGRTLAEAPDPELARVAISRVGDDPVAREQLARPEVLPVAVRLLGFSTAAADLLVRHPEEVATLADVRPRPRPELVAELADDITRLGADDGLRVFRRRAMLRVAARDLNGASLEDVVEEISHVAEACLEAACRLAAGDIRMAVIGLGKLGGGELNYASDVDLIFVHADGGAEAQEEAERAAAELIRSLAEPTAEGIALRVDPTLRPGGRGGVLSRSLEATLDYYEHQSATWERQAMIKARPVAGDPWIGSAFVEGVAPFVYPEDLGPRAIDDVRRTKVRLEEYIRRRGKELTEVKRGRGGIRDVEFAVQLLQIVHGRRDPRLREPNTLRALATLAEEGYVAQADADALADAYRFLRRVEHRLQIVRDLQTHDLPADPRANDARAFARLGRRRRVAGRVRAPDRARARDPRAAVLPAAPGGIRGSGGAEPRRGSAGDRGAARGSGLRVDREFLRGAAAAGGSRDTDGQGAGACVPGDGAGARAGLEPRPGARPVGAHRGGGRRPSRAGRCARRGPAAAQRLAHVAAASAFATDLLVAAPERLTALADRGRVVDAQAGLVAAVGRYASRELQPREIGAALADVADRVVREAVEAAEPDLPFAVIGMGKLGARELNVASDLDVMFVYEGEGSDDVRRAVGVAERVMRGIRDAGWAPDADLRPEGRSGPLARSVAAYLEYWERYAELWEFQALLRARHVAGDEQLGRRFVLNAADFAYPPDGITVDRVVEIRRMRERIERERVKPPDATKFHFKLGHGSLADVQFAVEVSLMRFGGARPELRTNRTLDAIERLAEQRILEQSVARDLGEAFVFLSDVKNALEVDRRLHAEAIPVLPEDQTALARRLGYEEYPRQSFIDDYLRVTRRCRRAMERVFHEEAI